MAMAIEPHRNLKPTVPVRVGALLLLLVAFPAGCVERRYTIRTNVPGTVVYANGEELGPAPVSKSFTYYEPREIVLVADGYQTQKIIQPIPAPWYDNFLTDFFTENLVPWTIRDERQFYYELSPATDPPANELLDRAEALRSQGQLPPPQRRKGFLGWLGF